MILDRSYSYQDNVIMSTSYTETTAHIEKLQAKKKQKQKKGGGGGAGCRKGIPLKLYGTNMFDFATTN